MTQTKKPGCVGAQTGLDTSTICCLSSTNYTRLNCATQRLERLTDADDAERQAAVLQVATTLSDFPPAWSRFIVGAVFPHRFDDALIADIRAATRSGGAE